LETVSVLYLDIKVDINVKGGMAVIIPFETTLEVRDTCLCMHMQRASRALARRFDDALRPVGITNWQFSLLMSLNRPEPPPMGPVAKLLAMDRTTLTAALKPLEREGLLKIISAPQDRRSRLLALTERGRETLAAAVPIWRDTHARVEAALTVMEAGELRTALHSIS
jgi:DNA-binding MarR family transcriptional regulator